MVDKVVVPPKQAVAEIKRLIAHTKGADQSMDTAHWRKAVRAGLELALLVLDGKRLEDVLATHVRLLEG